MGDFVHRLTQSKQSIDTLMDPRSSIGGDVASRYIRARLNIPELLKAYCSRQMALEKRRYGTPNLNRKALILGST